MSSRFNRRNYLNWWWKPGIDNIFSLKPVLTCVFSFPPGVINTVPSLGAVGGATLAAHPDVDKIAFTGSTMTGRRIMEAAAKSNLKKVSIDHWDQEFIGSQP